MPTYEYECQACRHRFERRQSFRDEPVKVCPECGGATRRLLQAPPIIFKGSGWYVTDSRPPESASSGSSSSTSGSGSGGSASKSESTTSGPAASGGAEKSDAGASRGREGKSDAGASRGREGKKD
jgi:putative FmdB family regulatory protein